jgi:hypothetical protein
MSVEGMVTRKFPKYLQNTGLTKHLKRGAKSSSITNALYSTQVPRTCPLTLWYRVNFLPLTEHTIICTPVINYGQVIKTTI